MAKLSSKRASATHRVIVYGASNTGKSLLAGKLSEHFNLIWFDLENGHETLFQLDPEWQDRIEVIEIPDTRSYPMAIETCLKVVKGPVDICEAHGKVSCMICRRKEQDVLNNSSPEDHGDIHDSFFTHVDLNSLDRDTIVVFDSMTQLSNSAIAHITKSQPDDYKLQHDDWGNLGKLLDIFLSHIQQAKYNVVVISHEVEAETEGKKKTLVPVGGTRAFSRNMPKYFGETVYAERKNKKHVFASSTTYATTILAGSRTGVVMEADKDVEGSLLQIFKPELYSSVSAVSKVSKISKPTGGDKANDILARIKKLNKVK